MTAHSTAKGIASLGRHGDDLIVHMNQEEVAGLQALAKAHGTSLTINPHTGMPEAFKLGGVFKALLPIAAGFALGPGGFGLFTGESAALMSGLTVGAATGLLTGNLGQGIMAGFGAYGGAGLGSTLKSLAPAGGTTAVGTTNAIQAATGSPLVGASSQFISPFTPNGIAGGAGLGVGTVGNVGIVGQGALYNGVNNAVTNQAMNASLTGANTAANAGNIVNAAAKVPASGWSQAWEGAKSLTKDGGIDRAKAILGTPASTTLTKDVAGNIVEIPKAGTPLTTGQLAGKIALPVGGALLGGVEPSDLNPQVNLSAQEEKVYEQTGVDANGKPTFGYIAKSAFNPYRTLNLSGPSPLNLGQALQLPAAVGASSTPSYAVGGTVTTGGLRDLYATSDSPANPQLSRDGFGIGRLDNLARQQAMTQAQTTGYAKGGYLDGQGDGMSDSIPATIEGKQPARLADGEFVVPADVVSHLGNGSSKAGSKRLYSMLDKVRRARTGTKRQGKQINPNQFLPA